MRLQTVPARRGTLWVRQGFQALGQRPMAFAMLFVAFYAVFALMSVLPFIGLFVALASLPLRSLGFMIATRLSLAKQAPTPLVFVAPLRGERSRAVTIVQLGALYALGVFLIFWVGNRFDGGALEAFWKTAWSAASTPELLESKWSDPQLQAGLLFRLVLLGLLSLPFWHAPALAYWGGQNSGRALFFSCVACWRNKAAFAAYGLTWAALSLVLGVAASLLSLLFDPSTAVNLVFIAASFVMVTAFFASLYFTYSDCFITNRPADPLSEPTSGAA